MKRLCFLMGLWASPAFAQCPDPSLEGATTAATTGPDLIAPQMWDVFARGEVSVPCENWAELGVDTAALDGLLPVAPTMVVDLSGMAPHILMVFAEAECRPVLAVRSGDGQWYFGEPRDGRHQVTIWGAPDGPLHIWVGAG